MITCIFLDWDGTLSRGRFWSDCDAATYQRIQEVLFVGNSEYVRRWMCGAVRSEEVCQWLARELGGDPTALMDALVRSCQVMPLMEELRMQLRTLRSRYTIVIVTDNMDCFSRFVVPALRLDDAVDAMVNSADVGYLKNERDGQVFRDVARRCGVAIAQSVLIDDAESTCNFFARHGGTALRTSGPDETLALLRRY